MTNTTICSRCGTVMPPHPGEHRDRGPIWWLLYHWIIVHEGIPKARVVD